MGEKFQVPWELMPLFLDFCLCWEDWEGGLEDESNENDRLKVLGKVVQMVAKALATKPDTMSTGGALYICLENKSVVIESSEKHCCWKSVRYTEEFGLEKHEKEWKHQITDPAEISQKICPFFVPPWSLSCQQEDEILKETHV